MRSRGPKAGVRGAHAVTVLLSPEEFGRLHRYCEQRGYKKSTLIARLVREHLDRESFETGAREVEVKGGRTTG